MIFRSLLFLLILFTFQVAQANLFNIKTIVIDAGHGGKDPGAIGQGKTYEKEVALAVALKLGDYIQKNFPDVKVVYTRKTDVFLELHERAAIANKAKADLFIAIHCNSSVNRDVYGSSSYVLGLHRTEANLEVAKRENSVINLEENQEKNYEFNPNTPEGHIIMSMKQNAFLDQSIAFAAKIEDELETTAKRKSLGVKQAGFYVLYKTAMPSLLAEIGFISNAEEEKYLNSERGQDMIAQGLYNAFRKYKSEMEGGETETKALVKTPVAEPKPEVKETKVEVKEEVKKETPDETKTEPQPVVEETVKETPKPEVKEPIKEVVKETPKETPKKATPPPVTAKTETDVVTLSDGTKIKKPLDAGGGGGTAIVANEEPAVVKNEPTKEVVKNEIVPEKPIPTPAKTETKPVVIEKPAPVKTEIKQPDPTPIVESNRHPSVPLMKNENGTIFRVQLFALKGTLKEYDKLIKTFKVLCAEELGNGITRYYGSKTTSLAEAEKYKQAAVANGYKDAYIVCFRDGKRLSASELNALE